ncbi:MAG: sensor histidine kinase [Actinobacteria bacterium]|nr:sensor histidine kinase [Actinomycetota bacterium]MCB9413161.1 sensor histidine kinase [Actinomycetota bacterium]
MKETGPRAEVDLSPAPGWTARMVDVLFYLGLAGLLTIYLFPLVEQGEINPLTVAAGVASVASLLAVHLRRRRPMLLFFLLLVASTLLTLAGDVPASLFLLPAGLFCLEAYDRRKWVRRWVVPLVVVALIFWLLFTSAQVAFTVIASVTLLSVVGWARGIRAQRQYRESLVERLAVAERERDLRTAQAVAAERARIARDIHDLVSHSLAVVAVQAAGAERIADRDPAMAKEALGVISRTARDALAEMRGMLEVLRTPGGESATDAPSPGLSDLAAMVDGLAERGVPARLEVVGEPYELAQGAELALYRVVQEALTNAVKHGDQSDVRVVVGYTHDGVQATVANRVAETETTATAVPGSGSGQLGMRERLAIYGGTLAIEQTGGDYSVTARLPRHDSTARSKGEQP